MSKVEVSNKVLRLVCNLIVEGLKAGINSDRWDVQVSEYRHWDL